MWDVEICWFWDFGSLGSFAVPVLLFDTSKKEPKHDQEKSRSCTGFYNVLKGSVILCVCALQGGY